MCVITFDWEDNDAIKKFSSFDENKSISWCILDLTDYCNFKCKWCYSNASILKNPLHMDIKDLERILDILVDVGLTQITYSGGEPTLYPHLKEAISLAKDRGLVVHMNTNGYNFTKSMACELKELGLSQVQINIDSIRPEKHDEVRGKQGSHERAIKALKNVKEAGMTTVSVTVLTKENEDEVVEIFKLARSLGIQRCRVWDMTPTHGLARENSRLLPKDFISALQKLSDFAYETGAKNVEVGDPIFIPHVKTKLGISGGYCVPAAGMLIYISSKGDAYFCCASREKMYNILEEAEKGNDIMHVHKQGINRFLSTFKRLEECRNCEYVNKCNEGCFTRRDFSENNKDFWCKKCNG